MAEHRVTFLLLDQRFNNMEQFLRLCLLLFSLLKPPPLQQCMEGFWNVTVDLSEKLPVDWWLPWMTAICWWMNCQEKNCFCWLVDSFNNMGKSLVLSPVRPFKWAERNDSSTAVQVHWQMCVTAGGMGQGRWSKEGRRLKILKAWTIVLKPTFSIKKFLVGCGVCALWNTGDLTNLLGAAGA